MFSTLDWVELERLDGQISRIQVRHADARSNENLGLAKVLAGELGAAQSARDRMIARLTGGIIKTILEDAA